MGTIEHRSRNSWRVGERLPAAQGREWIRRTLNFPNDMPQSEQRRAAELELARLMVDIAEGRVTQPGQRLTVRELADMWLTEHVATSCKPTTEATYRALLANHILPLIGDIPAAALTSLDLQRAMNAIRATPKRTTALPPDQRKRTSDRGRPQQPPKPLSEKTVRHCYDVMNYMFNRAVKWHLLPNNPLADVDRPRARRKQLHFLDDDQAVQLLRALSGEDITFRCAVLLALLCGLRLSEVGALRFSDVDWNACTVTVSQALHYTPARGNYIDVPKSEAGERVISLPAGMMTLLEAVRRDQEDLAWLLEDDWQGTGLIICNWNGLPFHHDTPSKQFRRFADRNGFEGVRFHDLRHTHASILLANNLDAVAVAARLGHESPETTLRNYAHAIQRRDRESADAMQHLIDRAGDK